MFLSFLWANYTGILLPRKKFLFLAPSKHKLGSFTLVTLYLYVLVNTGLPVVLKIKESNLFLKLQSLQIEPTASLSSKCQFPVSHILGKLRALSFTWVLYLAFVR